MLGFRPIGGAPLSVAGITVVNATVVGASGSLAMTLLAGTSLASSVALGQFEPLAFNYQAGASSASSVATGLSPVNNPITNLVYPSCNFTASQWQGYYGIPPVTTGYADPFGGNNATAVAFSAISGGPGGNYNGFIYPLTIADQTPITASIWLRADAPTRVNFGIDDSQDLDNTVGTTWTRYSVTGKFNLTFEGGRGLQFYIYKQDGINASLPGTNKVYFCQAQITVGTTLQPDIITGNAQGYVQLPNITYYGGASTASSVAAGLKTQLSIAGYVGSVFNGVVVAGQSGYLSEQLQAGSTTASSVSVGQQYGYSLQENAGATSASSAVAGQQGSITEKGNAGTSSASSVSMGLTSRFIYYNWAGLVTASDVEFGQTGHIAFQAWPGEVYVVSKRRTATFVYALKGVTSIPQYGDY
jgi:hypothetical protein